MAFTKSDLLTLVEASLADNEQVEAVTNKGNVLVVKMTAGDVLYLNAGEISDNTTPEVLYAICTSDYDPATNCVAFVGWPEDDTYYDSYYDTGLDCEGGEALCSDRSIFIYTAEHYEDLEHDRNDARDAFFDEELWFVKLVLNNERTRYEVDKVFNPGDD